MKKVEFMEIYIKPYLKKDDKPHNRQLFNDIKDLLHKDGVITDNQVDTWTQPNNRYFK